MLLLILLLGCLDSIGSTKFINGWIQIHSGFDLISTEDIESECFIFEEKGTFLTTDISGFMGQSGPIEEEFCINSDNEIIIKDISISVAKESDKIWDAQINWGLLSLSGKFNTCDKKEENDTISIYDAAQDLSCN